jgi:hypothetical protein
MVSSLLYSSLGVHFMPTTGPLSFRDDYTQLMGRAQSQWAALEVITDEFRAYVMDFESAIGAFRASLGATREHLDAFAKAALKPLTQVQDVSGQALRKRMIIVGPQRSAAYSVLAVAQPLPSASNSGGMRCL